MKIKKEDIERIIKILSETSANLKPGEYFEFKSGNLHKMPALPKEWSIKMTNEVGEYFVKKNLFEGYVETTYVKGAYYGFDANGERHAAWNPNKNLITLEQLKMHYGE